MNRRVPLWFASIAATVSGVMPIVAPAQETPVPIVIIDDNSPKPAATVADYVPSLTAQVVVQNVPDFWLGVHLDAVADVVKAQLDIQSGMAVIEVIDKGPAQKAGIQKHDIVTSANGLGINSQDDIFRALTQSKGEPISIDLVRKGRLINIRVTPEKRPDSAKPAPQPARIVIAPPGTRAIEVPVPPKPAPPALPPTDLLPAADSIAEQWIKELEHAIWQERKAAADQLQEARKAYEGTIRSLDVNEIESVINSAIDEVTRSLKDRVREGIKALQSDDAKAIQREVLDGMSNLERALRDQRELDRREAEKRERLELRERPASIESLRQEIKSLRDEIERIRREPIRRPEIRE